MSDQRPEQWDIWLVKMPPHPHPAVIVTELPGDRLLVIPCTIHADFDQPARGVAIESTDELFADTGLRQTSYLFPTGARVVQVLDAVMFHGILLPFHRDALLELLRQPEIAAIVRDIVLRDSNR